MRAWAKWLAWTRDRTPSRTSSLPGRDGSLWGGWAPDQGPGSEEEEEEEEEEEDEEEEAAAEHTGFGCRVTTEAGQSGAR